MSAQTPPPMPDVTGTVLEEGAIELARSYALALLNVGDQQGDTETILNELEELVVDIWQHQPTFATLLSDGLPDPQQRQKIVRDVFENRAHPTLDRLLQALAKRDRLALVPVIAQSARTIWNRRNRRVPVTVKSAVPLDDQHREALRQQLVRLTDGATPLLTEQVDPSLIGGLVIQIGDYVYDLSVRRRLEALRTELLEHRAADLRNRKDLIVD